MTTKATFHTIKTQQNVEKEKTDTMPTPGIIKPEETTNDKILSPTEYKKDSLPLGQIRQLVEQRLQEQYLLEDLCQLVEIKPDGSFRFTTGRGADKHLFKARWKIKAGELLVDFNKIIQTYEDTPPPMFSPCEIQEAKEEAPEPGKEIDRPLPHPDKILRERDYEPSPDEEIKTHPPMLDETKEKEGSK